LRSHIDETPEFKALAQRTDNVARVPVRELLQRHSGVVGVAMGASASITAGYLFVVWSMSYVTTTLGMSRAVALNATMICCGLSGLAAIGFGALSDRVGWRPIMLFGAICAVAVPFPMFWLFQTRQPLVIYAALTLAYALGQRAVNSVQPKFFHEFFPARLRYSGIALAREPLQALLSGPMPFVATALSAWYAGSYVPVAWLMITLGLFTLVTVIGAPYVRPVQ
jgi:MFS family permease